MTFRVKGRQVSVDRVVTVLLEAANEEGAAAYARQIGIGPIEVTQVTREEYSEASEPAVVAQPRMRETPRDRNVRILVETVIETTLIMMGVILGASLLMPRYTHRPEDPRHAAIAEIGNLKAALEAYRTDNGRVPTTAEGLDALVDKPAGADPSQWHMFIDAVPHDPWGNSYKYQGPGDARSGLEYNIISAGPDQAYGTADDLDVTSTYDRL